MSRDQDESLSDERLLAELVTYCDEHAPGAGYCIELVTIQRGQDKLHITLQIAWWAALEGLIRMPTNDMKHGWAREMFDVINRGVILEESTTTISNQLIDVHKRKAVDKVRGSRQPFHERHIGIIDAGCAHLERYREEGKKPSSQTFFRSGEFKTFMCDLQSQHPEEATSVSQAKVRRAWTEVRRRYPK